MHIPQHFLGLLTRKERWGLHAGSRSKMEEENGGEEKPRHSS